MFCDDNNVNIVIFNSMIGVLPSSLGTHSHCMLETHLFILSKGRGNSFSLLIQAAKLAPAAEQCLSRAPAEAQCGTATSQLSAVTRPYLRPQSLWVQPVLASMYQVMSSLTFQHLYSVDW